MQDWNSLTRFVITFAMLTAVMMLWQTSQGSHGASQLCEEAVRQVLRLTRSLRANLRP